MVKAFVVFMLFWVEERCFGLFLIIVVASVSVIGFALEVALLIVAALQIYFAQNVHQRNISKSADSYKQGVSTPPIQLFLLRFIINW